MRISPQLAKVLPYIMLCGTLFFASCQQNSMEGEGVNEVTPGPNASIIRNPVTANLPTDSSQIASIEFDSERYDFGEVQEGTLVEHTFTFKNTGEVPLIISDAWSTCGCTVPEWSEEPVPPGKQGRISVRFNTKNRVNQQNKPITLRSNTLPGVTRLYLQGFVVPAE